MALIEHTGRRPSLTAHGGALSSIGGSLGRGASKLVSAIGKYFQQRRDRAAFLNLVGKEEWVYRDMGIHRGDVEWAAGLPLHVNAAREIEKLRALYRYGR